MQTQKSVCGRKAKKKLKEKEKEKTDLLWALKFRYRTLRPLRKKISNTWMTSADKEIFFFQAHAETRNLRRLLFAEPQLCNRIKRWKIKINWGQVEKHKALVCCSVQYEGLRAHLFTPSCSYVPTVHFNMSCNAQTHTVTWDILPKQCLVPGTTKSTRNYLC